MSRTVLGVLRENPFKLSTMLQAQANLYANPSTSIEATHLYIKFIPTSMEDIRFLEEADIETFDYPLEYEVITMGDYYQDIVEGTYPTLYAVVPPNFVFPIVQHQIIEELYLTKTDPLLITEAFIITNNLSRLADYLPANTGLTINDLGEDPIGMVPTQPDCGDYCVAVLINNNPGGAPQWSWECDCTPPPPPPTTTECGCTFTGSHSRYPGGCVQVEDTQLGFKGVRRVKVIVKDNWFTVDKTWTNDLGCWQVLDKYHGKAWMWIVFKDDRCRIRGPQKAFSASWQWITSVQDYVGELSGPVFSNITVKYHMWTNQGSAEHMYWGAATVGNALHEFHDYAGQDGINTPPNGLDIYIGRNHRSGYVLMGTQFYVAGLVGNGVMASSFLLTPFLYLDVVLGTSATLAYLPDVYIGINYLESDWQKSLTYHEFAHVSHYEQVGFTFWTGLVNESILANGHGDQNTTFRDKLELCESWADFLGGMTYTHRTYGNSNSTNFSTWNSYLEHTWNESPNHIPVGLHHDLTDNGEIGISYNQNDPFATTNSITDNVSGITINTMFQALNSNTKSINDYKNYIIANSLGSNSSSDVNNLFNSY